MFFSRRIVPSCVDISSRFPIAPSSPLLLSECPIQKFIYHHRRNTLSFSITKRRHTSTSTSRSQHHDIDSFLAYAASVNLSPETTVYIGTLYEYTVLNALRQKNMILERCGGRDDKGIDLRGTWIIPKPTYGIGQKKKFSDDISINTSKKKGRTAEKSKKEEKAEDKTTKLLGKRKSKTKRKKEEEDVGHDNDPKQILAKDKQLQGIEVIVQCKATSNTIKRSSLLHRLLRPHIQSNSKKGGVVNPKNIRELEGSLDNSRGESTIGILASTTPCTKGMRDAMVFSRKPLCYVAIRKGDGVILQMVWNGKAAGILGNRIGVGLRYLDRDKEEGVGEEAAKSEDESRKEQEDEEKEEEESEVEEDDDEEDDKPPDREAVLTLDGEVIDGLFVSPLPKLILPRDRDDVGNVGK